MTTKAIFQRVKVNEARELLNRENLLLLDSRSAADFAKGHIQSASHLHGGIIANFITGTPKQSPVLIYCYRGKGSLIHAQTFTDFGFSEVYSLDGGFEAWAKAQAEKPAFNLSETTRSWLVEHGYPPGDVNAMAEHGITPLMRAGKLGNAAVATELIRAGARIETRNADGNNALWMACVGDSPEMIDMLISAGIDVDNQNDNGATCIMYAASAGKAPVVKQLISAGVNLKLESLDGFTAADVASTRESLDLLRRAG